MIFVKRKPSIIFIFLLVLFLIFFLILYPFKTKTKENTDMETLEKRILSLGEFTTVEYHYKDILHYQNTKELKGIELPFSNKSLLILYEGYIKAGVDLHDVSIHVGKEKNITLKLKKAHFTDNVINEEKIQVYDEKSGLFNPLRLEEIFDLLKKEKKKKQEKLKKEGFLEEANKKAEKLLIPLLKEMGFEKITIQFQS